MSRILVSGLINIETTLRIDSFPIGYEPVRYPFFGVNSTVSGVGFNVAKALKTLGDEVFFLSLIGRDDLGKIVRDSLSQAGLRDDFVLDQVQQTAQSVILYDAGGQRQIHVDLKDIQEQVYPAELFDRAIEACNLAVLCNINFSRSFLARAKQAGKRVATDIHAISDLEDDYNRDFMQAADILFMSDERLPVPPVEWLRSIWDRFPAEIVVISLGEKGALLEQRSARRIEQIPAVHTRPVANTIGAGDALFSSFVHYYLACGDPYESLRRAVVFASYKIGEKGAAEGFLDEKSLEEVYARFSLLPG